MSSKGTSKKSFYIGIQRTTWQARPNFVLANSEFNMNKTLGAAKKAKDFRGLYLLGGGYAATAGVTKVTRYSSNNQVGFKSKVRKGGLYSFRLVMFDGAHVFNTTDADLYPWARERNLQQYTLKYIMQKFAQEMGGLGDELVKDLAVEWHEAPKWEAAYEELLVNTPIYDDKTKGRSMGAKTGRFSSAKPKPKYVPSTKSERLRDTLRSSYPSMDWTVADQKLEGKQGLVVGSGQDTRVVIAHGAPPYSLKIYRRETYDLLWISEAPSAGVSDSVKQAFECLARVAASNITIPKREYRTAGPIVPKKLPEPCTADGCRNGVVITYQGLNDIETEPCSSCGGTGLRHWRKA